MTDRPSASDTHTSEDNAAALRRSGRSAEQHFDLSKYGTASLDCRVHDHWIEIELVDEDGDPVPGKEYRIVLPDGSVKEGVLDAEGEAGLEGIDEGLCKVSFPELDRESWGRE